MLRITKVDCRDRGVVLRLEGRLVSQWVELLGEVCDTLRQEIDQPLILDMAGVELASKEGSELLRRLQKEGIGCVSCSPFLKELSQL